jgi:hypothetical protein
MLVQLLAASSQSHPKLHFKASNATSQHVNGDNGRGSSAWNRAVLAKHTMKKGMPKKDAVTAHLNAPDA